MVVIALLRGVNVGGTGKLPMAAWRAQCERLGLTQVRTYIQSGNAVFRTREKSLATLSVRMEAAIEEEFGFRRPVILRSLAELRSAVERNPFVAGRDPAKLVATFLAAPITATVQNQVKALAAGFPEDVVPHECELFTYFPDGQGRTKLPLVKIERALGVASTARNWNTVRELLTMAEELASQ